MKTTKKSNGWMLYLWMNSLVENCFVSEETDSMLDSLREIIYDKERPEWEHYEIPTKWEGWWIPFEMGRNGIGREQGVKGGQIFDPEKDEDAPDNCPHCNFDFGIDDDGIIPGPECYCGMEEY